MIRATNPAFRIIRSAALFILIASLMVAGCKGDSGQETSVWIVQATGPLVVDFPPEGQATGSMRTEEQPLQALKRFLEERVEKRDRKPVLVLSGNLLTLARSVSSEQASSEMQYLPPWEWKRPVPPDTAAVSPSAAVQTNEGLGTDTVASVLARLPISRVLVVPGSSPPSGLAADSGLTEAHAFLLQVARAARRSSVRLSILTRCYENDAADLESCQQNLPDTRYRLVGFPTVAFTAPAEDTLERQRIRLQANHLAILKSLVMRADDDGRRVLIVTHTPDLEQKARLPGTEEGTAPNLTWSAPDSLVERWREILQSRTVAGVLAGYLHDSHRDVYRAPPSWASGPGLDLDNGKLLLAPPILAVGQENARVQAQGARLIRLTPDKLSSRLYWQDMRTGQLEPDPADPALETPLERGDRAFWFERAGSWVIGAVTTVFWDVPKWVVLELWQLPVSADGEGVEPITDLGRALVFLLATLFVMLTFVDFWQVSSPDRNLGGESGEADEADGQQTPPDGEKRSRNERLVPRMPFQSNLANTVGAGLLGLFSVSALAGLVEAVGGNASGYYVVVFIALFILELFLIATVRGIVEAIRIRQILVFRAPAPPTISNPPNGLWGTLLYWMKRGSQWVSYWLNRIWHWLLSLRPSFLAFSDTWIHLLMGRYQLRTKVFEEQVQRLHCSIVGGLEKMRNHLEEAIVEQLSDEYDHISEAEVRVNVSVLAPNQKELRYIPYPAPGSIPKPFGRESVAWISVYSGQDRWWMESYTTGDATRSEVEEQSITDAQVALYPPRWQDWRDAKQGEILRDFLLPGDKVHTLKDNFQPRRASDYEAFVVIPIPRTKRGPAVGALHISFRYEKYLKYLWRIPHLKLEHRADGPPYAWPYARWVRFLEVGPNGLMKNREVKCEIERTIEVLEPLLEQFNEGVHQLHARDCGELVNM